MQERVERIRTSANGAEHSRQRNAEVGDPANEIAIEYEKQRC